MRTITESAHSERGATVELRAIEPADAAECARIVYAAFGGIHDHHRFERDFPTLEDAEQLTSALSRIRRSAVS